MGKGRDKRKKNEDPAKAAKRAARQALKLHKGEKKEDGDATAEGFNNEEAIEVTLKRIQKAEGKLKTVEEVQNVSPPTPRVNVVFVPHPERDNEMILFGGEFWNGEATEAYNETYFFNAKKNAWARLSAAVNPAPRSSSQAVVYKHFLILFGGEFVSQSQSQYLHFKDVWRFDTRTSEWEELKTLKGGPSSRSGHRMALWKRNAVLFGGFYDNAQECRYFDDLWTLSLLDGAGRWAQVKTAPAAEVPHARSGHSIGVYQDQLFVYGGYSTQKFNRFKKSEATVHHDLWMIRLQQGEEEQGAREGGSLPMWTKIRLGGVPPPIRSGVSSVFKDKRLYLFGGVVDIESPGGKMVSTFNNDLFVFHMDTKRFYPVVLRRLTKKEKTTGKKEHLDDLAAQLSALELHRGESSSSSSDESESSDDDTGAEATAQSASQEMKVSYEKNRHGQILPHRRMDSALAILGNTLYLYGGQFESSKKEITISDVFALNLNKLDTYQPLLSQDLSAAVWLGKESESNANSWESGSTVVSAVFDLDYDEEDEEDDAGGHHRGVDFGKMPRQALLDSEDDGEDAPEAIPAELAVEVTPAAEEVSEAIDGVTRSRGKKGLKVHKEQLLAQLGASATVPTPEREETFAAFFERTLPFWMTTARESVESKTSDRRLKREASEFARHRYTEAKELLEQLRLVEEREKEEANFFRERRLQKEKEWEEYEAQQQRGEEESGEEKEEVEK
ncbi:hypothetical protein ABB37_06601 [Leptomonas pyrrhocoris]|uniref:DUF4110 domain-containing protein n=1 Tax=Leptomonas pyrrhocoris TaxID=157538 RepID=A0A0M9FX43_LEPPY|nr:hypothetical protein ABB37_06601 [Leptomonas pyrrhocoris]XP_015656203.1 hypothetical protein ABB37_06601 [Leptomonas pyrrhocoris]KPA77763.1 hypothetical protein ABB37_06601 [Leptomonas pyrrhocoris]KPA77764.1 hypothetical protein ABB37_06601 [Leptomonas pyrrhocoris]|eukprot:XP_015656202.1 hypothetical protein ABB37_06601 [Leptomonas pyrrhocoris]